MAVSLTLHAQRSISTAKEFEIQGEVYESLGKLPLHSAKVVMYDGKGNPTDTINLYKAEMYMSAGTRTKAMYSMSVPRVDSVYCFDVIAPGYKPQSVVFKVEKVGKREMVRTVPPVYLERAPRELKEVTVTASKVKFYNKGDTLVFNADAFQLAEGSMLDALISQLPGVKLHDNGQITFNGKYVEYLLLNGRDFMNSDRQLMLQNLGAYTVKTVELYDGNTDREKWRGDTIKSGRHLTMDVKLKKEYSTGVILNLQAGGGTKGRYVGKAFASWFSSTLMATFTANLNNLNDNRTPGKNDSWTPQQLPTGTKRFGDLGLSYDYKSLSGKLVARGTARYEDGGLDTRTATQRTNFLTACSNYERSFSSARSRSQRFQTTHTIDRFTDNTNFGTYVMGRLVRTADRGSAIQATFNSDPGTVTRELLDTLYSRPELLDAIVNRSTSRFDNAGTEGEIDLFPFFSLKIPGTGDRVTFQPGFKYNSKTADNWSEQTVNFGTDPTPGVSQRTYIDGSPNRTMTATSNITYFYNPSRTVRTYINYEYRFASAERNNAYYALERLADMGVFGTLPTGYLTTLDPVNSYRSMLYTNQHELSPNFSAYFEEPHKYSIYLRAIAAARVVHRLFSYHRDMRDFLVKRTDVAASISNSSTEFRWEFCPVKMVPGKTYRGSIFHSAIIYNFGFSTDLPDPARMIDFTDRSNPMAISMGNPDLHNAYEQTHTLRYEYQHINSPLNNTLSATLRTATGEFVRGYLYDTATGVRTYRTYNVDGNRSLSLSNNFNFQFGPKNCLVFSSTHGGYFSRRADMIGIDTQVPEQTAVNSSTFNQELRLTWQIGKQSLTARATNSFTSSVSDREGFRPMNVQNHAYGLQGQFRLPLGIGVSSDFMLYTRRGYGSEQLDKTDPIWNLRATYTRPRSPFTFMLDGFDLLQRLTNITYAVTPSGRMVSYTNTLPRYVLLTVQYRFNRTPKAK